MNREIPAILHNRNWNTKGNLKQPLPSPRNKRAYTWGDEEIYFTYWMRIVQKLLYLFIYIYIYIYIFIYILTSLLFFLREFRLMTPNNIFLSLDQDINRFLV